jgi:hypothetical protein
MTREEALRAAREWLEKNCVCECPEMDLATLLLTAVLAEREANLAIADQYGGTAELVARAIRARSKP